MSTSEPLWETFEQNLIPKQTIINEKIEISPQTKKEVRFIQKWVWNVISSANHTGRTIKHNNHPVQSLRDHT